MNTVAPEATAFAHRQSNWLLSAGLQWNEPISDNLLADRLAWLNGFYDGVRAFASQGAFQNFPDPSLKTWAQDYYQGNLARLRQIKANIDPDSVFQFPQAI